MSFSTIYDVSYTYSNGVGAEVQLGRIDYSHHMRSNDIVNVGRQGSFDVLSSNGYDRETRMDEVLQGWSPKDVFVNSKLYSTASASAFCQEKKGTSYLKQFVEEVFFPPLMTECE